MMRFICLQATLVWAGCPSRSWAWPACCCTWPGGTCTAQYTIYYRRTEPVISHLYSRTWLWIIILLGGPLCTPVHWSCSTLDLTRWKVSKRLWSPLTLPGPLVFMSTGLYPLMSTTVSPMSRRLEGPVGRRSNKGQSPLDNVGTLNEAMQWAVW